MKGCMQAEEQVEARQIGRCPGAPDEKSALEAKGRENFNKAWPPALISS